MSGTVTFDDRPAAPWRDALKPERRGCAVCGQNVCGCSDLEYAGLVPPLRGQSVRFPHATDNARG